MVDHDVPVTEEELHAYVDGQLPADRVPAVESWLAARPDELARIAGWRAQAEAIRERHDAIATEPVPGRLTLAQLKTSKRASARLAWTGLAAAATVAAFAIGGLTGWTARGAAAVAPGAMETVTAEALDAYKLYVVEVRHPVEVPGSEEAHLVQWLSKRLGYQLRAPDLSKFGLKLVGGRLLPGASSGAGFFMYENAGGERFTLYCVRSAGPDTALRYRAADETSAFFWVDRDVAYVVSGPPDRKRLWDLAAAAYDQLDPRVPRPSRGL